jgi:hypothetical protein
MTKIFNWRTEFDFDAVAKALKLERLNHASSEWCCKLSSFESYSVKCLEDDLGVKYTFFANDGSNRFEIHIIDGENTFDFALKIPAMLFSIREKGSIRLGYENLKRLPANQGTRLALLTLESAFPWLLEST